MARLSSYGQVRRLFRLMDSDESGFVDMDEFLEFVEQANSYGPYSYGLYSYGPYSYGLYSYGLLSCVINIGSRASCRPWMPLGGPGMSCDVLARYASYFRT